MQAEPPALKAVDLLPPGQFHRQYLDDGILSRVCLPISHTPGKPKLREKIQQTLQLSGLRSSEDGVRVITFACGMARVPLGAPLGARDRVGLSERGW